MLAAQRGRRKVPACAGIYAREHQAMPDASPAMSSAAAEDYLRRIASIEEGADGALVSMGQVAERMGVAPGTATAMVKKLAAAGYLEYEPYAGVRLTAVGQQSSLALIRRHRLVELFLVEVLGLDWSEIDGEAELLEHAISERLLARIDALLGHPTVDPHGDPIPAADLSMAAIAARALVGCQPGERLRLLRVLDQDAEFLRFLDRKGLRPGVLLTLVEVDVLGDSLQLQVDGQALTLGGRSAAKLMVEPEA